MNAVVVPYSAQNSSVRTRAVHWVDRTVAAGAVRREDVRLYGPGFESGLPAAGSNLLLVRNARRVSRGRVEERLLRRAQFGVYDLDDGLPWDDGNLPGLGRWWKRPFPRSLLARRAAAASDRVVAGNDVIADWACEWNNDVRVVPTCVEPSEYRPRVDWTMPSRPLIGWIGSPATEPYLTTIAPALRHVAAARGAVIEIISGTGQTDPSLADIAVRRAWTPDVTAMLGRWDVGIMPLTDGVYERAKCGYKLLQYAASGVPAVGAPVGVNRTLLARMDGYAPETVAEWTEALIEIIDESPDRRRRRATAGFAVAEDYSYDRWQAAWLDAVGW